jgi:hypothetical protein
VKNVEISSDIINTKIPRHSLSEDKQIIYIYLDKMDPHETRSLLIDFENINS